MAGDKGGKRLRAVAREFNVGVSTLLDFLQERGIELSGGANAKIDSATYKMISKEYQGEAEKYQSATTDKQPVAESSTMHSVGEALSLESKDETVRPSSQDSKKRPVQSASRSTQKDKEAQEAKQPDTPPTDSSTSATKEKASAPQPKILGRIELPGESKKDAVKTADKTPKEKPSASKREKTIQTQDTPKEKTTGSKDKKEVLKASVDTTPPTSPSSQEQSTTKQESKKSEPELTRTPQEQALLEDNLPGVKIVGSIDLEDSSSRERKKGSKSRKSKKETPTESKKQPTTTESKPESVPQEKPDSTETKDSLSDKEQEEKDEIFRPGGAVKLAGPTVVGSIDLKAIENTRKPEVSVSTDGKVQKRRRRKRLVSDAPASRKSGSKRRQKSVRKEVVRVEISKEDVDRKIKETRARLASRRGGSFGQKYRKEKRSQIEARKEEEQKQIEQTRMTLQLSEFASVNELAGMMNVPVTDVIEACMNMGLIVTINQRLDAESLMLVADEFGFKTEFVDLEELSKLKDDEEETPEDLEPRIPVVTLMGHVDHGKTKLCDAIQKSNVIASEAGGITQHTSAYLVQLADGRRLTLIDTPGHESFTAMRARGAKLTDIAIIVISAEDGLMPQTKEAIAQANLMDAQLIFAINKIDSPRANPEKVKEQLAGMNYLVEDWGGNYQSQEISAKFHTNIDLLLDKVFLEAEMLDLKANPHCAAEGTVIEASIDKGRGRIVNVLIQKGTLHVGDIIVAGGAHGRVKALLNERDERMESAGPSIPVRVLGLDEAPQAGDNLVVMESDKDARVVAEKVRGIRRQQEMHVRKHITLDEIGRRIAIGNFQELNLVVKADVDGSCEALSDSLLALSTPEIQVNIISRGVGQITEGDVLTAMTSNAIIIGFQVRPSVTARKMAETEQIDIRLYSVIYETIEEIRSAMEGMLSPEVREEITGTAEVLETFKISKVGTVAGCNVTEGKIYRTNKVRIIRDGIVVYDNELESLKRFKDEAKEVVAGQDCGISIKDYNDIKVGDILESYKEIEVKRTL